MEEINTQKLSQNSSEMDKFDMFIKHQYLESSLMWCESKYLKYLPCLWTDEQINSSKLRLLRCLFYFSISLFVLALLPLVTHFVCVKFHNCSQKATKTSKGNSFVYYALVQCSLLVGHIVNVFSFIRLKIFQIFTTLEGINIKHAQAHLHTCAALKCVYISNYWIYELLLEIKLK